MHPAPTPSPAPSPSPNILATTNVPYSALSPAPTALVRSLDGQLAAVSRGEIHLFTLALGYTDAASVITSNGYGSSAAGTKGGADALAADKGKGREHEMPLLHSTISVEKRNTVKWGDWADEYDLAPPGGGAEAFWRSAAWSPSGMSALGGCVLATLTTNAEVLLFEPPKNSARGEWFETADLTLQLIHETVTNQAGKATQTRVMRREMVASLLRCQTSTLAWSSAVPGTVHDLSLLALGHRSGEVTLWRLNKERQPVRVGRFKPHAETNVVSVLSWSEWTVASSEDGIPTVTAQLALADADGRVFAVPISQPLPVAAEEHRCDVAAAVHVVEGDERAAMQLCWVEREGKVRSVHSPRAKLGTVHLAQLADAQVVQEWELELETVGADQWMGATAWAPCSGLAHLPSRDALLVSLSSASFHLIRLPTASSPALTPDPALSDAYTAAARICFVSAFARVRQRTDRPREGRGAVTRKEGARSLGMVALGSGKDAMDVAWVCELARPDAFVYRTPTDRRTYLTVANLAGADRPEGVLSAVDAALAAPENGTVRMRAPLARLGPLLHALAAHAGNAAFVAALLQRLQPVPLAPLASVGEAVELEERIEAAVNADEELGRVRIKEALARGLLTHRSTLTPEQEHAAVLAQLGLARQLLKEVLGRLTAALGAGPLTDAERPLHARLLLASASLLPPSPADPAVALLPADALAQAYEARDVACPACKAHVPLANVRYACCEAGHQWERCSLSLALIASVQVRTCSACERKALLPEALGALPPDGAVRKMLAAAKACVVCGGRWVRVR
ncbi:hypothetical protein JCM3770_004610 [Rhodotorula araucariae]